MFTSLLTATIFSMVVGTAVIMKQNPHIIKTKLIIMTLLQYLNLEVYITVLRTKLLKVLII